jgi:hypothetical protein
MVLLRNGQKLTGTGTVETPSRRVAGYVNTNGVNSAVVTVRSGHESGPLIFDWNSPAAAAIWPTIVEGTDTCYYSVSGTGAFLVLFEVEA